MLKNTTVIVGLLVVAIISYFLYDHFKVPAGVQAQGDSEELVAWISLATAIISLIVALIGLIEKIMERRRS